MHPKNHQCSARPPLRWIAALFSIVTLPFRWIIGPGTPAEEYRKLCRLDAWHPSLFTEAQKHPHRNRFSDVLPNESTRFKLASDPNFYFNANWVLDKQAIACQGPLETEINQFWQMVWHADVKTIAMLANPVELGRNKCSEYWKSSFSSRLFAALSVQCISETTVFEKDKVKIVERTIRLTKAGKTKEVTQYHLQNWPDFGVVEPEALAKLVTLIDSKQAPFLAHCNAGIGRTGTFLAAYQAYKQKTSQIYNIAAALRNPQKGRMGMIQTAEQYALARETAQLLARSS
ncbi:MAG: protein-tyrosine phosphatase family protein [Simkaniaceae bacterium]|nr:protein-tyrosine phosphatase family protein [Candidatus Sacchlamyda saccharinae]